MYREFGEKMTMYYIIIIIVYREFGEKMTMYYIIIIVYREFGEKMTMYYIIIIIIVYREFGEKMTMYWRILKDDGEIEMILKVSVVSRLSFIHALKTPLNQDDQLCKLRHS